MPRDGVGETVRAPASDVVRHNRQWLAPAEIRIFLIGKRDGLVLVDPVDQIRFDR